jgi:hypothetical protein
MVWTFGRKIDRRTARESSQAFDCRRSTPPPPRLLTDLVSALFCDLPAVSKVGDREALPIQLLTHGLGSARQVGMVVPVGCFT